MKIKATTFLFLLVATFFPLFADEGKPNIVFVLADDMGSGDLSCYGGAIASTPQIDRMAKEGTRFNRYYSAAPICSPSRCGLITGQFPAHWQITSYLQTRNGNRACEQADFLDPKAPSLPRTLKASGYATAHIGKWHLGGGRDVTNAPKFFIYGYDENVSTWESPEPHPDITSGDWVWRPDDKVKRWNRTAFFVDKTLDFISRHKDKSCFVNLWLDDPHTPWVSGKSSAKGDTRDNLKAVLEENDRQIGRLMDKLPTNTLLIFASDNGALPTFKGERTLGLRGSKLSLYEGGIRLPFIARWRGKVPAGRVDDSSVVSAVDIFLTLCEIAGAKLPDDYRSDGENRSEVLLGKESLRKKPLLWEYGRNTNAFAYPNIKHDHSPNLAILDGNWKLLLNSKADGEELYDLASDPNETKNLFSQKPDVARRLASRAMAWHSSLPITLKAAD